MNAPPHDHKFPLGRPGSERLPQVDGENGARAVKDGCEGGDQRSNHHSRHQSSES